MPNTKPGFLQVYFLGDDKIEEQIDLRMGIVSGNNALKRPLIKSLQEMLHSVNPYIREFKTTLQRFPATSKDHRVILHFYKADNN